MSDAIHPSPVRRGPYAKTAQRKAEIIQAATAVFAARGYHGGSLRDIASQLGLSLASVAHHFPTKVDLLEAVLDYAHQIGTEGLEDDCRREGLRTAMLRLVASNFGHPELLRMLAIVSAEASAPEHPAHARFALRYARLTTLLAEFVRQDREHGREPAGMEADAAAKLLVAAWDGLQLQWLLDPRQDMLSLMTAQFDAILGPRETIGD